MSKSEIKDKILDLLNYDANDIIDAILDLVREIEKDEEENE